jgi:proteasome lid subunit RPN8/RPN11
MKFKEEVIEKIFQHALKEYPNECFGVVTGDEEAQTVHACENILNSIRQKDPGKYSDARTGYFVDRKKFDMIASSAKREGKKVIAFYHSHPDIEAYFSATDVEAQTVFGEPEFPEALHIVVSVMNGKIHDVKCFRWDSLKKGFIVIPY